MHLTRRALLGRIAGAAAFAYSRAAGAAQTVVKIGIITALSGFLGPLGKKCRRARLKVCEFPTCGGTIYTQLFNVGWNALHQVVDADDCSAGGQALSSSGIVSRASVLAAGLVSQVRG
jgi:hypothetical protein